MNTKFNLGAIEIKIPAGESNPEINFALKDMSYEVTDMSLTEYAGVLKVIFSEAASAMKEFGKMHEESKQCDFQREQTRHETRRQEIKEKVVESRLNRIPSDKQKEFDSNIS
jgi:hypothetical protein